jgi:hypothetical protein
MLIPQPFKIWSNLKHIVNHVSKYIIPFVFGHGSDHHNYSFNSGTAILIDLGKGPLVLTCEHVTTPFRQFKECHGDEAGAELYIGGATGIGRKIIAWDETLDIATLPLTKDELALIPHSQQLCGTEFINEIYTGPIKENDVIVLAGFSSEPSWRYKTGVRNLVAFHPCVCFAEAVSINNNNDYIICQSDHRIYEVEFGDKLTLTDDPAGMSGGAAFLVRQKGDNFTFSFIGIISGGKFIEKNCLIIYVKLAKRLNSDGTIKEATT